MERACAIFFENIRQQAGSYIGFSAKWIILDETSRICKSPALRFSSRKKKGDLREIHDREPLVVSPEAARKWIRLDLPGADIAAIAQLALPSVSFSWHEVATRVNNVKNDGAELVLKTCWGGEQIQGQGD